MWNAWERTFTTNGSISSLTLWLFHLFVATFQQHLHMVYISLHGFIVNRLMSSLRMFYEPFLWSPPWLDLPFTDCMCYLWPRIWSIDVVITTYSFFIYFFFIFYEFINHRILTRVDTNGERTANAYGAPISTSVFVGFVLLNL